MERFVYLLLFLILPCLKAFGQPIPVGSEQENQYRLLQLLSDSTVEASMNLRPLWKSTYDTMIKQTSGYQHSWWAESMDPYGKNISKNWRVGLYDPVFINTVNTDLPYGGNNGAAWYGRGLNSELHAGLYITSRFFTATFRPHLIYTQNAGFSTPRFIPKDKNGNPEYTAIFKNIDMPFRFGPDSYTDFNLGQTSVRLHYKSIEAGLSNETLWWGPGIQNALMLSNNAPGLKHAFFGTRYPLALPLNIGKLGFKVIWAQPHDSKYFKTTKKTNRKRFSSGLNISFSPGIAPNLSLGFIRFTHRYVPKNGLTLNDFISALPFISKRQGKNQSGRDSKNQLASVYFRWVFPKSNAEVYGEYFREDSFYDLRDLFFEPDHDRAYTIGFQKVVESSGWFDLFKINGEINNLVPDRTDEVRPQTYYYRHGHIKQGHTNGGQVLGAAIGPGSASQYLGVDGYLKKASIGLFVQRVADNDFFHFEYYNDNFSPHGRTGPKDMWRHRINLNIGLRGHYKIGPLLFNGRIVWDKNFNYGRFHYGELKNVTFNNVDKHDIVNMQFQLSVRYNFGSILAK